MGAFMNLPSQSLKEMSKVNVGPNIDLDYIKSKALSAQDTSTGANLIDRYQGFFNRPNLPLQPRLEALDQEFNSKIGNLSSSTIQRHMRAKREAERALDRRVKNINYKFDELISRRKSITEDFLTARKENSEINLKNHEARFLNRAIAREERAISRYLETPKGKKELANYDSWIKREISKRQSALGGKDIWDLRNSLFNQYTNETGKFKTIQSIQEKYTKRLHADKKELFNPWFRDVKENTTADLLDFESRSRSLLDDYISKTNLKRREAIESAQLDLDSKLSNINDWIDNDFNKLKEKRIKLAEKYERKRNNLTTQYNTQEATYNELRALLSKNGVSVGLGREGVIEAIRGVTDNSLLTSIDVALKNRGVSFTDQSAIRVNQWKSNGGKFGKDNLKGLTEWFINNAGHDAIDAERKAKMFMNRAGSDGVLLKDGAISFVDKADGNRVSVPLTSYTEDGVRYHNMGKGNYSVVRQFNPYASAYIEGLEVNIDGTKRLVTATDLVKGFDPEKLIEFLPEGTAVSSVLPKINRLFHYNSQDAGVITQDLNSEMFKNSQGIVDLGTTLKYDQYGEVDKDYPIKSLKLTGTKDNASEINKTLLKLASELDPEHSAHLMDGLSLNNRTSINTSGFSSLAVLAPNERGETSVGNRGTRIVSKNSNTQMLEDLLGSERFNKQFSSSQVLSRIDVQNDKLFNSIASAMFGNDYVLGDGAGFFNMGDVDSLRISDRSIIKIPMSKNMAISNSDLLVGLTSTEGFNEYIKNNPINITNDAVAYDSKGAPIGLNKMYTSGTIVDGFIVDNDIRLVVDAQFDPAAERNVKLFSTGTKSLNTGVNQAAFDVLGQLGLALNQNRIKVKPNGNVELDGVHYKNVNDLQVALAREVDDKKRQKTYVPANLISRADDTGGLKVIDMVKKGAEGNKVFDTLTSQGVNRQVAGMTAALFSEHKAAVDLTTTVGVNIEKAINAGQLNSSFRQDFLYHFNADNFRNAKDQTEFLKRAATLVASSGIVDQYLRGESLAVGSFNKGSSIVGKGKQAKMSWAAITNLRESGVTTDELNRFGITDKGILSELRSISDERRLSANSVNNIIQGREASFLHIISQKGEAETRLDRLKGAFGRSTDSLLENPYLTYNLSFRNHSVQSLNFSRITTDRSGLYEKDSIKMLKELEQRKMDIMLSDLAFRDSKTKEARVAAEKDLVSKLDAYDSYTKSMLSGDNNLLKSGLSLYSDKSSIMEVKYIGGEADVFASQQLKQNKHSWFISEQDAEFKAKQLGLDIEYQKVGGYKNLFQPMVKRDGDLIPLSSMVTREPAQGPLSSDLISWYVDKTISGENSIHNAYVPVSSGKLYYSGMFGDGDQDTVQTLLGDFKNRAEFDSLEAKRAPIRQHFMEMVDVTDAMKVKGKDIGMKTIADFSSDAEYAAYRVAGGLKGRNRKSLAAPATGLAVSYSKALELELGHLGGTSKELTQGRVMIHNLVENLLKSAKLDTDSFQLVNEQAVEKLSRLRSGFLGKGDEGVTALQYEKELRATLPEFLGINSIDESTAKGKVTKATSTAIMESIINAELKHATTVGNTPFTPLDLNEKRYSKNSSEYIDTLNNIIKEQGITDIDYEDGIKHLRKSTGQVALGSYDYLLDVAKSNKGVILGGLGAMAGVALLGRDQPNFSDSRSAARQYGANMLPSPGTYDEPSQNNAPMGMETNPNKAGFILPKSFGSKGIKVGGDFINNGSEMYAEYNSLMDTSSAQDQMYNMANSIFGDGIRSARLQTN